MSKDTNYNTDRNYYAYKDMSFIKRLFGHLGTVFTHKRYVGEGCFKMGLYAQGIMHDMSKFSPTEFIPSVKYYSGTFSPNATSRVLTGVSTSWLHHKGRNKHHFEYWIDYMSGGEATLVGCRMPLKYVAEMVADRYAACVAYNGDKYTQADPWNYYAKGAGHITIDEDTRAVLEAALIKMRDEGKDEAFAYMKRMLKITKGRDYDASIVDKV